MTSINRIDQAMLVLKDKLQQLNQRSGQSAAGSAAGAARQERSAPLDPLVSLRQMVQQGRVSRQDLRKALVRTLLVESFGDELVGSLEFQSISDRVSQLLEQNDTARELLDRSLAELG
ncbi:MAG: hypothetical protein ABI673_02905 [Novosphingobium sp.]